VLSVQAMAAADKAREARGQHFDVLKELGDCYAAVGDHARARESYLAAGRLEPDSAEPHVGLGIVAVQAGRLGEAEDAFETAARKQPRCAEAYGGLAMVRQQRQDYPGAFDMYLKCLELDADNLVALLGLFQTSCKMGTFARVIHYLRMFLDRHPGDTSVQFCLATLYAREGELGRAEELLLNVLALQPDNAEADDLLAEVRERMAESDAADAVRSRA